MGLALLDLLDIAAYEKIGGEKEAGGRRQEEGEGREPFRAFSRALSRRFSLMRAGSSAAENGWIDGDKAMRRLREQLDIQRKGGRV